MARKKRSLHNIKPTLIFVGEGETEKAFLHHIYSLFSDGSLKITIKCAGGKGPNNIISDAISSLTYGGFDKAAALLDTDIPWPKTLAKQAENKKIPLIGATPCIEGLMLNILNQAHPHPSNNQTCKKALHPQLCGKPTDKQSYQKLFTKEVLTQAKNQCPELKQIIDIIQAK